MLWTASRAWLVARDRVKITSSANGLRPFACPAAAPTPPCFGARVGPQIKTAITSVKLPPLFGGKHHTRHFVLACGRRLPDRRLCHKTETIGACGKVVGIRDYLWIAEENPSARLRTDSTADGSASLSPVSRSPRAPAGRSPPPCTYLVRFHGRGTRSAPVCRYRCTPKMMNLFGLGEVLRAVSQKPSAISRHLISRGTLAARNTAAACTGAPAV